MAAKTVELTINLTLTKAELELLDRSRKRSSRAAFIKKLIVGKGISKSGFPYTGDPDTDEILDDVEATKRLMDFKNNPPDESELFDLEDVLAEIEAERKAKS